MNIICRNFIKREFEKGKKWYFSPFPRIFDPRKKPRFSIKCGKSVIFQHMWHHRSSKKGQNFKIFYSEVFSSFKGGENKISWSYRSYSLLHITKHRKKPRFSIFRTVVNVAAEWDWKFESAFLLSWSPQKSFLSSQKVHRPNLSLSRFWRFFLTKKKIMPQKGSGGL